MNSVDSAKNKVKAVDTTCKILTALQERSGAGVTELADHLDLSKGAVHKHLKTLEEHRFIHREQEQYKLGLRFVDIAESIKDSYLIHDIAKDELQTITDELNVGSWYMVEEKGLGVVMYSTAIPGIKTEVRPGGYSHLHHIAAGKAMLAEMPEDKVHTIIETHGLPQTTPETITDPDELFAELEEIRNRGIAFNREEKIPGVVGVGAAVTDLDSDDILGGVSVGGPMSNISEDMLTDELTNLVERTAKIIEVNTLTLRRSEEGASLTHLEPADLSED